MQIALTKKLAEKMKLTKLPPMTEAGSVFTWRANISQSGRKRMLVFMNDASRYVLVIQSPKAKTFQRLPEVFIEALRNALLMEQVNPDVIDRYIAEMGDIAFVANSGKQETAWLNKACDNAWFGFDRCDDDTYMSVFTSHMNIGSYDDDSRSKPSRVFLDVLSKFGLPVRKSVAYDLTIRLGLDGEDATRVIRMPANLTFFQLHKIIQKAYNWQNYHYFNFSFFDKDSNTIFSKPVMELIYDEGELDIRPEAILMHGVRLEEYIPSGKKCVYYYDYGDGWEHHVELSRVVDDYTDDVELPHLLYGVGDAPPEDVGGPGGFADFLEIVGNPEHEEYEFMTGWAKDQWWKRFDFESVARSVKHSLWW